MFVQLEAERLWTDVKVHSMILESCNIWQTYVYVCVWFNQSDAAFYRFRVCAEVTTLYWSTEWIQIKVCAIKINKTQNINILEINLIVITVRSCICAAFWEAFYSCFGHLDRKAEPMFSAVRVPFRYVFVVTQAVKLLALRRLLCIKMSYLKENVALTV